MGEEGKIFIDLYRDTVFHDVPESAEVDDRAALDGEWDKTASFIRYGELLTVEIKSRYPNAQPILRLHPGDGQNTVQVFFHPESDVLMRDILRLASDLEQHRQHEWLVYEGSNEALLLAKRYEAQTKGEEAMTKVSIPR